MGRSKSETTSTQTTTNVQETAQAGVGDFTTGKVFQAGGNVSVVDEFPEPVQKFATELLGLTRGALDLAGEAGGAALQAVQTRFERAEQPGNTLAREIAMPALIVAAGLGALYFIVNRKG